MMSGRWCILLYGLYGSMLVGAGLPAGCEAPSIGRIDLEADEGPGGMVAPEKLSGPLDSVTMRREGEGFVATAYRLSDGGAADAPYSAAELRIPLTAEAEVVRRPTLMYFQGAEVVWGGALDGEVRVSKEEGVLVIRGRGLRWTVSEGRRPRPAPHRVSFELRAEDVRSR